MRNLQLRAISNDYESLSNQRRFVRHPYKIEIRITLLNPIGRKTKSSYLTHNISSGGLRFDCADTPLSIGDKILIHTIPCGIPEIRMGEATVLWLSTGDQESRWAGVTFKKAISDENMALLRSF